MATATLSHTTNRGTVGVSYGVLAEKLLARLADGNAKPIILTEGTHFPEGKQGNTSIAINRTLTGWGLAVEVGKKFSWTNSQKAAWLAANPDRALPKNRIDRTKIKVSVRGIREGREGTAADRFGAIVTGLPVVSRSPQGLPSSF